MTAVRFESADEDPWLNGVLVEAGEDGLATSIEQILEPGSEHRLPHGEHHAPPAARALRSPTTAHRPQCSLSLEVRRRGRGYSIQRQHLGRRERGRERVHPPRRAPAP